VDSNGLMDITCACTSFGYVDNGDQGTAVGWAEEACYVFTSCNDEDVDIHSAVNSLCWTEEFVAPRFVLPLLTVLNQRGSKI
jgi:hypothetical protein